MQKVIAIDGPCGSGKSSVAKQVAHSLKITHIDTGAMYRSLGLYFSNLGYDLSNLNKTKFKEEILDHLNKLDFVYESSPRLKILINKVDLTELIRTPNVSNLASLISQYDFIRNFLTDFQRNLVQETSCVMEGRDIGSVVFPKAICKFYLTASVDERAKRRVLQLSQNDQQVEFDNILKEVQERDFKDMNRDVAPLIQSEDAILIDSTSLSEREVIEQMITHSREKFLKLSINL